MGLTTETLQLAEAVRLACIELRTKINGNATDLSGLTTTAKGNLVLAINELAGLIGSGGASAWDDITDKPAAVTALTGTNTGDQDISGKLDSTTAASTYAPISTTVTLSGTQTLTNKTFPAAGFDIIDVDVFSSRAITGGIGTLFYDGNPLAHADDIDGNIAASRITTGNIAVARIANALTTPGAIGGTTPAAISATTVTASGAVALTGTNRITFGGTSSTYAALKYSSFSSGRLAVRLADDSAYAQLNTSGIEVFNGSNRAVQFGINMGGGIGGMGLSSEMRLVWASTSSGSVDTNIGASTDTGITRISAGLLGIGTGGAGSTAGSVSLTNLTASGTIKTGSQTAAAAVATSHATAIAAGDGAQTYISDTDKPAWSNGTVWKYADSTTVT
jgi:hypothetical protein